MEVMNQARRLKRIRKGASLAGQAAAEAAVPSKKIKFLAEDVSHKGGSAGEKKGAFGFAALDEDSDDGDANADIIMKFSKAELATRKKAAVRAQTAHEKDATETKISKGKMKALQKLKDRQEREAKREDLFASLAKHHVDSRAVGLLKSSSALGAGKETKKQKLSRALKEERAGLAVTASSDLLVSCPAVGMESHAVGESARARRRRLEREQEEREQALLASSDASDDESSGEEAARKDDEAPAQVDTPEIQKATKEADMIDTDAQVQEMTSAAEAKGHAHSKIDDAEPAQRKPAFYVTVKRNPEIQQARSKLPMFAEEQQVMEAIQENDVIVLCGATGCGKSTQLPQFLYEAGYGHEEGVAGMIGCTQPRRVAAITTAKRIAKELNMPLGKQVGFQVRYEKRIAKDTKIKVMTDGILLKEIQSDFLLSDYSAIVVDEAHERGINSDVLIGLLSRLVPLRRKGMTKNGRLLPPLKLIIMSATLRVTDFTENAPLFPIPPPVIEVSARQHPVTVHFNRRTPVYTYMQEALKKACKIHRKLPGGGILIFLTGRREIDWMCRNLRLELAQHKDRRRRPTGKVRDGAFTSTAAANGDETRSIVKPPAVAHEAADIVHKEAFLFGQDDGAESDGEGEGGEGDGEEADDELAEASGEEGEEEEGEEEEEEDLPDEEYDLSESEEEGEEKNSDSESEDEEEKGKRTVQLDGKALAAGGAGLTGEDSGALAPKSVDRHKDDDKGASAERERQEVPKKMRVYKKPKRVMVLPLYSMLPGPQQLKAFNRAPKGVRMIVVATNVAETSITIPGIRYVVDTGRVKERVYQKRSGVGTFSVNWASQASVNQRAGRAGRTGPGHCYRLFSSAVFEHQFAPFALPQILCSPIEGILLQMKAMAIPDVRHFPYPTPPDEDDIERALKTLEHLGALTPDDEEVTPLGRQLAAFPLAPRFAKMLVLGHQGGCLPYAVGMVAALSVENPIVYDRADATAEDSEYDEPHENVQQEEDEKMEAAREQECAAKINNKKKGGGSWGRGRRRRG